MFKNILRCVFFTVVIISACITHVRSENLYDEGTFQSLISDKKAFRQGDSLTVIVVEAARAESSAATGSDHATQITAATQDDLINHNGSLKLGASSGGDAVTSRHGFLSAQLAVTVLSISDNGLLNISGEQSIVINGEEQKITISGSVRREDISKDNTILSNRLTNAHIEFSGDGVVTDAQDTSVFYKIFQWLGLI